jgi:hypothetical protein
MRPCLEDPGQWDKLQKQLLSRHDHLLKISEYFSLGYSLQLVFNYGTQALDKNFNKGYVKDIAAAIKNLNSSIRGLKLGKKNKNLGCMSVPKFDSDEFEMPEQTMQGDETDDSDEASGDEASGDEASGDEVGGDGSDIDMGDGQPPPGDRPEVPDQIMKVLASMGGDGGLLQKVLLVLEERFQIPDTELAAKFEECQEKIKKISREAKIDDTGTLFQINLGQLEVGIYRTQDVYNAIREDPGNKVLQQEYEGLRKDVAAFMVQLRYPENFVDALAPSAQGMIDEFNAEEPPSTKYAPELDKIMERFGGQDGCLSRYLHSKAAGETDKEAKAEVLKIRDAIHAVLEPDDSGLLDGDLSVYSFKKERLEKLVEAVELLKGLEKTCEADPSATNKFNLGSALESAKKTLGHKVICEAVIGDIETSQRFLGKPKAPKRPKVHARPPKVKFAPSKTKLGRTIAAPSGEDDANDIMSTQSNPRVVLDVMDGRSIEKQILHVKEIKKTVNKGMKGETSAVVGWHLLLKYHDKERYKYPSFEMVPGSMFPGAVQGFLSDGGTELALGTAEDLRGFSLSDLDLRYS